MLSATREEECPVPRALDHIQPPGEDTLDLPESLGRLVAVCTWLRELTLSVNGTPPGTRLRIVSPLRTEPG